MNTPLFTAAAAKLLAKRLRGLPSVTGERERGIATIERAMQARSRRRRAYGACATLAAAAALALAVHGARHLNDQVATTPLVAINVSATGPGAALRAGDRAEPLAQGSLLGAGQRIETPADGGASLQLSTGTALALSGSTAFRVDSQGAVERFSLQHGELSAHVAKLTAGQRFIVATPDAEVEVRGTRFRLHVLEQAEACGEGSRTRLEVTEGVVEVRRAGASIMIKAGQQWPSDCGSVPKTAANDQAAPLRSEPAAPANRDLKRRPASIGEAAGATPATAAALPVAPERTSALTQPNDLYQEGVALRRQGDVSGALRAYQEVITRFPGNPLAENARVERMRVLAKSHDGGARDEARLYLARYPHGFAANEAKQLSATP